MHIVNAAVDLASKSCEALKGVGARMVEKLGKCGISTVQDLLFHLPFRYQDRTHISPIGSLRVGESAVIEGVIERTEVTIKGRSSLLLCLRDGTGIINIRFFNFYAAQQNLLQPGIRIRCFGEVRFGRGIREMVHPEYQCIVSNAPQAVEETLTPIYSTTIGLTQKGLRGLAAQALTLMHEEGSLQEYIPLELLQRFKLPSLQQALQYVHRPPPDASLVQLAQGIHPAQQRLAFEELLAHRLSLLQLREKTQKQKAPVLNGSNKLEKHFLQTLPFVLTAAQQRVIREINADLIQSYPMLRLVQGDVGSGKTIVALLSIVKAVEAGYQAALMVPTELLAEQHFHNFQQWFAGLPIHIALLTGKHKGKARSLLVKDILSGKLSIVIGTHALFQESIEFAKLGLIVIDEQHRFGVHQRLALREKGNQLGYVPHQLIMTATPIPRTLAMTAYADLDVSVIDELPPGRKPIKTVIVPDNKRMQVVERVRQGCLEKRQCYWVCPLIEESEVLSCQAAEALYARLVVLLPELTIGLVHGRTKSSDKENTMKAFKSGELHLLIATTVIEVGVDVPNASLMIIENAERLGIAQLHQLRGRVGRGAAESYCVLLYQGPLSSHAKERLAVLRSSQDGFVIAKKDLELRGPGELLGTRQTGLINLRIADLRRDQQLLPLVQDAAAILLQKYKFSVEPLIRRWLVDNEKYADV